MSDGIDGVCFASYSVTMITRCCWLYNDGVEVLLEKKIFTPKVKKFSSCAPNIVMFHFSFAASSCTEIQ